MADDVQANIGLNIDTSNALAGLKALQSELSAIHTQLSKLGPAQRASAAVAQRALVDNINATGKFAASMTTVRTTAESFTHALEKNKLTMGEYFRYAGGASKSFGKMFAREFATIEKVAIERVKTLQTQYIKLGRDANGAMKAIQVRPLVLDMNNLQTKTAIAAQKQQILNQLLKQGSTAMLNWGKNTQWAGRQLMVGFSIPIGIFASKAMQAFSDLEKQVISFKRVYGDLGTTAKETDAMAESIKNLALEFTKYGVAVADTMDMAAKAAAMGKTGADLLGQVQQANKLAVLGQVDQQQALQTTITLSNAFGTATQDLGKKINFLNAVENQTVLSIEDLTTAIPKAGPVVKQLGGDVEDLAFFLTAMKEGGINASEGANALKSGLASIINPTNKAKTMLQGFGINLDNIVKRNKGDVRGTVTEFAKALDKLDPLNRAKAIEQLFGKFQFARISTLMKNVASDSSQAATTAQLAQKSSIELAVMSAREMRKISSSPLFKFQKAIQDFQAQLAPVGEQFMKFVTPIIDWVNGILKAFNNLGDGTKQFIVGFTSVVAGLGPILLMTFGLIANGFANIIKGFAALKSIFNKTQTASEILGQETSYMTEEQMKAKAVAASLDQVHGKLIQTFNVEAGAVNSLAAAYERAVVASRSLVPGAIPGKGKGTTKTKKFATGGIIQGPGTETSDSIIARVSKNEAIIPAKNVKKYPGIVSALIDGNIPGFSRGSKKKSRSMADKDSIIRLFQSKSRSAPSVGGKLSFAGQMQGMVWDMFEEENAASAEAAYQYLINSGVDPAKAKKIVEQKYTGRDLAHTNPKYKETSLGGRKFKEKLWTAAPGDTTPDLRTFNQFFADRIEKTKGKKYATGSYIGDILQDENRIAHISEQSGLRRADVIKELKKFEAGQYPKPGDEKALRALRGFAAGESGAGAAATVAAADVRLKNFGKAGSHGAAAKAGKFNFDPRAEELATKQSEDMRKRYQQTIDDLDSSTKAKAVQTRKQANSDNEITKAKESQAKSAKEIAKQNLQEARAARTNGDKLTRAQKKILAEYDAQRAAINAKTKATKAANKKAATQSGYVVSGVDQYIIDADGNPVEKTKKQKTPGRLSKIATAAKGKFGSIFSMSQAAQAARGAAGARLVGGITGGKLFGAGMAASIGGNLIGGMVGGEAGSQISGAGDIIGGVLSVASLFGNKLGPILGTVIPMFAKLLPVVGWAVAGFQLLTFAIDKATESERKKTEALKNRAAASGVSRTTMESLASFFGTNLQTGSFFSTAIQNGSSSALGPVVDELRQNEGFKQALKDEKWVEALKTGSLETNTGLLTSLAIRFGADLAPDAVAAIISAIQAEAGVSDIKINFKSIDVSTKEGRQGIIDNVSDAAMDLTEGGSQEYTDAYNTRERLKRQLIDAKIQQARINNDPELRNSDMGNADQKVADIQRQIADYDTKIKELTNPEQDKANAENFANFYTNGVTAITAAFKNGTITVDEYKDSIQQLQSYLQAAIDSGDPKTIQNASLAINTMIDSHTGLDDAQKGTLKRVKDLTTRYKLYTLAITNSTKAMDIASKLEGLDERIAAAAGRGKELLRRQKAELLKELDSYVPTLDTPTNTDVNDDPYGTGKDTLSKKQQARQKKWQDAMSIINLEEEKINKKYEDRIAALDKVNELNQAIAASQKDQLDLADALSRGDIAAAARAAQTMRSNDSQREYEKQKRALEQAQQNELNALTVLVNGKYYTKDQIQGKLDYYERTSLNNSLKNNTVTVATGGMVKHYEPGGDVRGPGTGTSDDIPAMLSNGEYVIRAKAVEALGLDTLDKLNHAEKFGIGGFAQRFADGGIAERLRQFRISEHTYKPIKKKKKADDSFDLFGENGYGSESWANTQPGVLEGKQTANSYKNVFTGKADFWDWLTAIATPFAFSPFGKVGQAGKTASSIGKTSSLAKSAKMFTMENRLAGDKIFPTYTVGGKRVAFEGINQVIPGKQLGVDVVRTTPEHLLNTALKINPKNKANRVMLNNIMSGKLGANETRLLDKINAATGIDNAGRLSKTERTEGFAEILSALSGNRTANRLIDKKLSIADSWINKYSGLANKKVGSLKIDPTLDDVTAIRSFNDYKISRNSSGEIESFPAGNYSTTPIPRSTLHVTLEDVVQSHMQGQWSPSNMKVVTGFNDLLRRNPTASLDNIRANDTWFTPKTGSPLVFPKNSAIIRPFTDKDEYVKELIRRGLHSDDKIAPIMAVDEATKEVLHLSKAKYNTAEMAQIAKLNGMPITGNNSLANLLKQTRESAYPFAGKTKQEIADLNISHMLDRMLDVQAIQKAKSLIGKNTPINMVGDDMSNAAMASRLKTFANNSGIEYSGTHAYTKQFDLEKLGYVSAADKAAIVSGVKNKLKAYPFLKEELRMAALKGSNVTRSVDMKRVAAQKAHDLEMREFNGFMPKLTAQAATGGLIQKIKPRYFAEGDLAKGTDTIPAMLTPGEFIMTRSAVQNFGVDNLRAINAGVATSDTSMGESVYNYSINVNVSTNSDANDIARTVMTQIKRIDSQRVRGV